MIARASGDAAPRKLRTNRLNALVAAREPVPVDQILPDTHRVPAALQLQRDQFAVRFAAARRSATRFPGQKAGDHLYGRF